ncbi:hypothetical protein [Aquipseudomonas alcaligenes]|uniref:Uncharacterized protein n=1 Tax=Aquipseudomonas alcaligenes (strain ATCC 14909 / DSM 50342 / CCUG 1425 / JCM 20561 / NBRC 14159 / NCIMB 9945 / NCTC 10367 / 1577) TaxID=1215092 RepID=U2Z2M7_AQUA1|nr:hypothetical protein [Pseudomonas alcaligenes]GAD62016.1 hypothetical protein PA6_009_00190 [Pseudomonas alcaligenes NBRC 14159]SUD16394.1 Uncharacterised protein [Pseudomonas alcaligenes]
MSFGFFARGNGGHLIIDENNPVLRVVHSGDIKVSQVSNQAYSACTVTYPSAITTPNPPMVFGVPTHQAGDVGLGLFCHLGAPGRWTGFRVIFAQRMEYRMWGFGEGASNFSAHIGRQVRIGAFTGWRYHACVCHPAAPIQSGYGLRVFNADGLVIFDSNWPIAPFRRLLTGWYETGWPGSSYPRVGGQEIDRYQWGFNFSTGARTDPNVDVDPVTEYYAHPWGARDGDLGIMISSVCAMSQWVDFGDFLEVRAVPFFGFRGDDRSLLRCMVEFGYPQHKSATAGQALNGYGLLTADFSRI